MRAVLTYSVAAALTFTCVAIAADEPSADQASDTAPATQPLRISGVPAAEWLNTPEPVQGENLQGRLWVLGVVEPWSAKSQQAATMLADLAKVWLDKGVTAYLVTVQPAEQVRQDLPEGKVSLPIGAASPLPLLLGLDPLPQVYLVGPEQTVVWSGPVWHLSSVLPEYYQKLTESGLSRDRANELSNRLNRANAAFKQKEYFLAVGLASLVAQAAPPGHPLHREAEDLLAKLDRAGSDMLAQAQQRLAQKRTVEAYDLLQTVAEQFYGTQPSTKAVETIKQLERSDRQWAEVARQQDEASAGHTLELAQAAMMDHRYSDTQRYYRLILDLYGKTQAANQARQGLVRLRNDKVLATQIAEQKAEPSAPVLLNLAARYVQIGRFDQARRYYEQVAKQSAGTSYAEQARKALRDLPAVAPATQAK